MRSAKNGQRSILSKGFLKVTNRGRRFLLVDLFTMVKIPRQTDIDSGNVASTSKVSSNDVSIGSSVKTGTEHVSESTDSSLLSGFFSLPSHMF